MADFEARITPTGLSQRNLVDLLYMIIAAIQGICTQLDADAGVNHTTHLANCFTAIFNGKIVDSRANKIMNYIGGTQDRFWQDIKPAGVSGKAQNEMLYQIFNMMKTLTAQLDNDGLASSGSYLAYCYTVLYLWMITNEAGNTLGNGNTYWFNPQGVTNQKQLVDLLAAIVDSITTMTQMLDADATVTGKNYTATWYTATILMLIENSSGNVYGNASTMQP
ncbi:MAG: hypothetical protein ACLQBQ_09580 [Smithella sp.]